MRLNILLLCLICFGLSVRSEDSIPEVASDTISSLQLKDVVVTASRGWVSDGAINVIPTKKEKKLSDSPASLIRSMHLPFVKEKDGQIVTLSGQPVQIFINGEKANDIDIATFWPKNVNLVQYLENPTDPTYEGAKTVINFKMPVYKVGGVTSIRAFENIPNDGRINTSSKLSYKKMTFGMMLTANYRRNHRSTMKGETKYSDIYYDGIHHDEISRLEEKTIYERDEGANISLNAKYATQTTRITHTVSLGWRRDPGSGSHSSNLWSSDLFDAGNSSIYKTNWTLTPQFKGDYFFKFSDHWFLTGNAFYSFAHNKSFTSSILGNTAPVDNHIKENVNTFMLGLRPILILPGNWQLQWHTTVEMNWFSSRYFGSIDSNMRQSRQEIATGLAVYWNPVSQLSLSLKPGMAASIWQIGEINEHSVSPTTNLTLSWTPSAKISLFGTLSLNIKSPTPAQSNPVLVKYTELEWFMGNPHLKSAKVWNSWLQSNYMPTNWLSMSLGLGYYNMTDGFNSFYLPAPAEKGGLIQQITNIRPYQLIICNLDISGSFLNDNLTINLQPAWNHHNAKSIRHLNYLDFSGAADYTLGNCRFGISYQSPTKSLSHDGLEESRMEGEWTASATYGNGNLNLGLTVKDIFNNKENHWERYSSPYYYRYSNYCETGRTLMLTLSYTFDYGKKTDRSIDISGPEETSTSIYSTGK